MGLHVRCVMLLYRMAQSDVLADNLEICQPFLQDAHFMCGLDTKAHGCTCDHQVLTCSSGSRFWPFCGS